MNRMEACAIWIYQRILESKKSQQVSFEDDRKRTRIAGHDVMQEGQMLTTSLSLRIKWTQQNWLVSQSSEKN